MDKSTTGETKIEINPTGIDLRIDESIIKICDAYVSYSNGIKKILYFVIFILIFCFLAMCNAQSKWAKVSNQFLQTKFSGLKSKLKNGNQSISDSLSILDSINSLKEDIARNRNEISQNYRYIHIPIIETSIHINDLGILSGIAISGCLISLIFFDKKKQFNLLSTFKLISDRYKENSDGDVFKTALDKESKKNFINKKKYLAGINYLRREYHYKYLSIQTGLKNKSSSFEIIEDIMFRTLLFIPSIIYGIIFIYDFSTYHSVLSMDSKEVYLSMIFSILLFFSIFYFNLKYHNQQRMIEKICNKYKTNGYTLTGSIVE